MGVHKKTIMVKKKGKELAGIKMVYLELPSVYPALLRKESFPDQRESVPQHPKRKGGKKDKRKEKRGVQKIMVFTFPL